MPDVIRTAGLDALPAMGETYGDFPATSTVWTPDVR